jgi:methylglutaconyl-CoA hydratase
MDAFATLAVHCRGVAAVLDAAVDATVVERLAGVPDAQREVRQRLAGLEAGPITEDVRELTAQTISRGRSTDEAREGFAAFAGRRRARWIPA